jgi:hypothetical protein
LDRDQRYFLEHPGRRFRLRSLAPDEPTIPCPPGCDRFVLVEQLAPGVRFRAGFYASRDRNTDITDGEGATILARILIEQPDLARLRRLADKIARKRERGRA